jgi:predicted PurR-regulated permease PerM
MERRINFDISLKSVITVAVALLLVGILYYVRDILILFLIAFVLATALEPLIDWFESKKVPRILTMAVIYSLFGLFIYIMIRSLIPPINDQITNLTSNRQVIVERINTYLSHMPIGVRNGFSDFVTALPDKLAGFQTGSLVTSVFGVVTGLLAALTVLVTTFYLLLEKNVMEKAIKTFWPADTEVRALSVFKRITEKISLWARGQIILSSSVGLLTFIGLSVLRFEYALVLAVVAGFMDIIPFIGPTITLVIGVALAFAYSPIYALWVAILFLGVQQFEAHVLVPQIMKRAVGISPVLIIFAILIMGKLLGIVGVLIAVPVAAILVVLVEEMNKKGK